jgi:aminopeptidase N
MWLRIWPGRLPAQPRPKAQKLILHVDMEAFRFEGATEILVENSGAAAVTAITVHAGANLAIGAAQFRGKPVPAAAVTRQAEYEFLHFDLDAAGIAPLASGERAVLDIAFSAEISANMGGFYRARYEINIDSEDNKVMATPRATPEYEWLAVTDFEPTDARTAFPCFDEPALKAEFTVEIWTQPGWKVLGNMPQVAEARSGGESETGVSRRRVGELGAELTSRFLFEPTPLISTYLVCYTINKFDSVRLGTIAAWGAPHVVPRLEFSVQMARYSLAFYADAFSRAYFVPKLDMLACPSFEAGAMENVGLVTFRDSALIAVGPSPGTFEPPGQKQKRGDAVAAVSSGRGRRGKITASAAGAPLAASSASELQYVAVVISHELSHQWFGDLVSPEWWDYLWLNEAFAAYMEALPVARAFPEWGVESQFIIGAVLGGLFVFFVVFFSFFVCLFFFRDRNRPFFLTMNIPRSRAENLLPSMLADALPSSHPIESHVNSPIEIQSSFDAIVYEKGASVIRMAANFLGEAVFFDGIAQFIRENAYATGTTQKLFDALSEASTRAMGFVLFKKKSFFFLLMLLLLLLCELNPHPPRFFPNSTGHPTAPTRSM